ncbi:HAD family hydrolase [Sphingomonas sp. HT-1]|jgi:HAD superfamily hydrolase (TIGR01509 family)|uniref:HAD family hydrolase n=1 Tax=unclassified Sphingomonas TaxID=196159 RepID=UPI0003178366|nr:MULTISPECIES: HAD family phosphatase [unclassified Sphingomonas]KTF68912.1 HAD family hydrolase [Sphingomonas sp. WG]
MIKAVLFDMDGVLIEAKDWHYEALNLALTHFGMEIARDAHLATFDGLPTRDKLNMLTKTRGFPRGLHDFTNRLKQSFTQEIAYARCRPVFHHRDALSRLKQQGYHLAVCSNSIVDSVKLMMSLSKLDAYLDLQLSAQHVERGKPDPAIYNLAMEKLGVTPAETLILEDNDHGIQAARASGAHLMTIGTTDDVTYPRIRQTIDAINAAAAN